MYQNALIVGIIILIFLYLIYNYHSQSGASSSKSSTHTYIEPCLYIILGAVGVAVANCEDCTTSNSSKDRTMASNNAMVGGYIDGGYTDDIDGGYADDIDGGYTDDIDVVDVAIGGYVDTTIKGKDTVLGGKDITSGGKDITSGGKDLYNRECKYGRKKVDMHKMVDVSGKYISHLLQDAKHAKQFNTVLGQTREKYYRRRDQFKKILHYGQLKLHLSEVELILLAYKEMLEAKEKRPLVMIYAGAAGGFHIKFLSKMFPEVYFELYDPAKFAIKETDKIKIYNQLFLDKDAKKAMNNAKERFDNPYIMLVSDIRLTPATEEQVERDMEIQLGWWKVTNPDLAMYKFRLPWRPGTTTYPEGEIYTQAFPGATSTETRLIFKKNANLIKYDNIEYEERCFHHNVNTRLLRYDLIGKLDMKRDGVCNCYDCAKFIYLTQEYFKWKGEPASRETILEFIKKTMYEIMPGNPTLYLRTTDYIKKQCSVGLKYIDDQDNDD